MTYIRVELDEREREEVFRLKRFKQLKYKNAIPKGSYLEEESEEELEVQEPEPSIPSPPPKPKVQPEPEKITPPGEPIILPPPKVEPIIPPPPKVEPVIPPPPKVEPIIPPTPKIQPCSCESRMPPVSKSVPIIPPTPSVQPCGCTVSKGQLSGVAAKKPPPPTVESIIPSPSKVQSCACSAPKIQPCGCSSNMLPLPKVEPCGCASKISPSSKFTLIIPPCMLTPKIEKAPPLTTTATKQERLDHLTEHLNQILQIAKELEAAKQTPRIGSFIKSCDDVKGKIKDLCGAPSPRVGSEVYSTLPNAASRVPSVCIKDPSICSKKPSTQSVIKSDVFDLEPKTTLGEFEKRIEKKITVTRTKNPDGSIREEKQIITIQTEVRTPCPEKDGGEAKSLCSTGSKGEYSGGKRGGGNKRRSASRTPSWTSQLIRSHTPSGTSKFSRSRTPSCTCKIVGSQTPSADNVGSVSSAYFSSGTNGIPSQTCCAQETSNLISEISKPCISPKPSEHSKPCVPSKLSETAFPLGTPKPNVPLDPCECLETVPSHASATRQPSDVCTCGSSYFSTTASFMNSAGYTLPRNEQSSCVGSPKKPTMNKRASKSKASSLLGSGTCSCRSVPVTEKQSKETRNPIKTKFSFKSVSTSAHSFLENVLEKPEKKRSESKSTYCVPNCSAVLISKTTSFQSKCLSAIANHSPSTTSNSLKSSKDSEKESDCTRTSSYTLEASIDDAIVVSGSRLNALRKMILPSMNSKDCHITEVASFSNWSSYRRLCASSQTSATSVKSYKAPFEQITECLTCLPNKETKVEADISYTDDANSCDAQSVSIKIPETTSNVLAECRAAVAALAEHISRTVGTFSPGSSNIWYSTLGTPKHKDAMTSPTSHRSDSNSFEVLDRDEDCRTDTHPVNEQDKIDLVHKVSS